jgi:HAD superfamily hydrolase (TIGR01509 family)
MKTPRPSRWLLIDFGNVLSVFSYEPFIGYLSASGDKSRLVARELFLGETGLLDAYETGQIGTGRFLRRLRREIAPQANVSEIRKQFCGIFTHDVDALDAVRTAKPKFRIAVVSNTNPLHYRRTVKPLLSDLADLFIASHRISLRKPDPGFFGEVLRRARTSPEQCIFFDDLEPNVEAARIAGIEAHLVTRAHPLAETMRSLGLIPPRSGMMES